MTALGFIGAGNMGFAIIKGFTASPAAAQVQLYVYDILPEKRDSLRAEGFYVCESEHELAGKCKYIVLACKPQQLAEVIETIKPQLTPETVLISLCAGISMNFIRKITSSETKIVLVMPNMPMMLGKGTAAIAIDEFTTAEESAFVRRLMESCGIAEEIPADKMNEIICVNASAPAFVYAFAKCFTDYAREQGIDEKAARVLISQTLIGSGEMLLHHSDTDIADLIAQVTSKGGTTFAGLEALNAGGFADIIRETCEACTKRAYEMENKY